MALIRNHMMNLSLSPFPSMQTVRIAFVCLVLLLPEILLAAEGGKFQFVIGEIKVISSAGIERRPVKGDSFNTGDTIFTGAGGTAQIRMGDGGLMAIRANTQLRLDQYVFNGREDGNERSLLSLVKGGFRAITGLIGNRNKDNYRILTPSATIGIRGTDHEPVVIPTGAAGGFQAGTYDRVYRGAVIMETEKGKLIVYPNQVGFTPSKHVAPVILPKIPEFYALKPQQPNASKDSDTAKNSGDTSKKSDDSKVDSVPSLSNPKDSEKSIKDTDSDPTATLLSPLDSPSKDLKPQQPNASKDSDTANNSGDTSKKSDGSKVDSVRSLSNLKDRVKPIKDTDSDDSDDSDPTTTLRSPLDSPSKDSDTAKNSGDTRKKSDGSKVETLTVPTTTIQKSLRSPNDAGDTQGRSSQIKTDALSVPVTSTLKPTVTTPVTSTPVTGTPVTTTTPITTIPTTPITTITTPITTAPKAVETLTVPKPVTSTPVTSTPVTTTTPITTIPTTPITTITTPITTAPKAVKTLTVPKTTIQKPLRSPKDAGDTQGRSKGRSKKD